LLTVLTSACTTLAIVWGVYNYASIPVGELKFGSTIVNITGTDKLKDFPAAYNATVNSLNATKLEISDFAATTSMPNLAGVGTITSGTWNATAIAVNRGGTGLTSYTAGDILYATGATTLAKLGIGADGQLLTLSGGLPVWGSPTVDLTQDYSWTGHHIFSSLFATNASSTNATTTSLNVSGSATVNNLSISGTCEGCSISDRYLASTTAFSVGSGSQTRPIESGAKEAVVTFGVNNGTFVQYDQVQLFKSGATTTTLTYIQAGTGTNFGTYSFHWGSSVITITEVADAGAAFSMVEGIIYWYK